jgi:hypothetical protein
MMSSCSFSQRIILPQSLTLGFVGTIVISLPDQRGSSQPVSLAAAAAIERSSISRKIHAADFQLVAA